MVLISGGIHLVAASDTGATSGKNHNLLIDNDGNSNSISITKAGIPVNGILPVMRVSKEKSVIKYKIKSRQSTQEPITSMLMKVIRSRFI